MLRIITPLRLSSCATFILPFSTCSCNKVTLYFHCRVREQHGAPKQAQLAVNLSGATEAQKHVMKTPKIANVLSPGVEVQTTANAEEPLPALTVATNRVTTVDSKSITDVHRKTVLSTIGKSRKRQTTRKRRKRSAEATINHRVYLLRLTNLQCLLSNIQHFRTNQFTLT